MNVKIIREGTYLRFSGSDRPRATKRTSGDVVDYPEWYAMALIDRGHANAEAQAEVNATPSAIALAEESGIDLVTVDGTGSDGRTTKADVRRAIAEAEGV